MTVCPCRLLDSEKVAFDNCCGPILDGKFSADTAEALMRSRYSAYVLKNIDYVDRTQINAKNEVFDKDEALKWAESSDWLGLEIKSTTKGQVDDNTGLVEFVAHYQDKESGTDLKHHETSLFTKNNGEWKFQEGQIHGAQTIKRLAPKVGRNDPCSCGSGRKFKKCCGV